MDLGFKAGVEGLRGLKWGPTMCSMVGSQCSVQRLGTKVGSKLRVPNDWIQGLVLRSCPVSYRSIHTASYQGWVPRFGHKVKYRG